MTGGRYAGYFWPGLALAMTVGGFMILGDALRDALDPRPEHV